MCDRAGSISFAVIALIMVNVSRSVNNIYQMNCSFYRSYLIIFAYIFEVSVFFAKIAVKKPNFLRIVEARKVA